MTNALEALSNFEINKRVALARGLQVQEIDDSKVFGMTTLYHEQKPDTVWVSDGNEPWYQFCPTHCGGDAWPIIADNRIALTPFRHDGGFWEAHDKYQTGRAVTHTNPLRAAMCVFLIMQENSNG